LKHCWKCSTTKPKLAFGVNSYKKDGLASECRDCKRSTDREYAAKNREAAKQRANQWYQDNKEYALEKHKEYSKQWKQDNKDKHCSYEGKRRAKKLQATPLWLTTEHYIEIESIYKLAAIQQKTTSIKHHVDHIVPLQGKTVCGLHVPWNLQVLTASQNCSKSNKFEEGRVKS
jgi:hypothetical protein